MKERIKVLLSHKEYIIAAAAFLAVLICLVIAVTGYEMAGGAFVPKGCDDLRGVSLSIRQYEKFCADKGNRVPWDVPLGEGRYDSEAEAIVIGNFEEEELENFKYFSSLKEIDATGASCYKELLMLSEQMPECRVFWTVEIGGESCSSDAEEFTVPAGTAADELQEKLAYLPCLKELNLAEAGLDEEQELELAAQWPDISYIRGIYMGDKLLSSDMSVLSFKESDVFDAAVLAAANGRLASVAQIELGERLLTAEDYLLLKEAYPQAQINCMLSFYGVAVSSGAEELVLDGIQIEDTAELDAAVACMPNLKKIYMDNCGLSDDELGALDAKYENVRIVWTVYIKWFECRTDADNFCVSRITSNYGPMTDAEVYPIRFCTDMVTLDLGHMDYESIDFVENMPHLRYLIFADTYTDSIEPLRNLKELYYLEMFLTYVTDLSPLYELKELRHLNISYCKLEDYTQLFKLTWLDRLWFVQSELSLEEQQALREALPNTEICFYTEDGSSVDYWWRIDDSYFEMRDNLGMWYHYRKPGT